MLYYRKKVVWSEGMALDPHHFQQWGRYHRALLDARIEAIAPYSSGLTAVEIDEERLANGEFAVVRCAGVLPDGYLFDVPQAEEPPRPRNLADYFGATESGLLVHLTLPLERSGESNLYRASGAPGRDARFSASTVSVVDENTGEQARQIEVARANLGIHFEGESLERFTTLPIARVKRNTQGAYVLDETYVPPCLRISGSNRILAVVRGLLEVLVAKRDTLLERHQSVALQRDFSPADALTLGLLGTLNTSIPVLNHILSHPHAHPEAVYLRLLELAGGLVTYLPDAQVHPREFPVYDHHRPSACFNDLDALLRRVLGGRAPRANYMQIQLQRRTENLLGASVDAGLLERAVFYLVVRAEGRDEGQLVQEVPRLLRLASPEMMKEAQRAFTPTLEIEHTHRLPSGMPVDNRANYFLVRKQDPYWSAICREAGLEVFVPSMLSDLNLHLLAVEDAGW